MSGGEIPPLTLASLLSGGTHPSLPQNALTTLAVQILSRPPHITIPDNGLLLQGKIFLQPPTQNPYATQLIFETPQGKFSLSASLPLHDLQQKLSLSSSLASPQISASLRLFSSSSAQVSLMIGTPTTTKTTPATTAQKDSQKIGLALTPLPSGLAGATTLPTAKDDGRPPWNNTLQQLKNIVAPLMDKISGAMTPPGTSVPHISSTPSKEGLANPAGQAAINVSLESLASAVKTVGDKAGPRLLVAQVIGHTAQQYSIIQIADKAFTAPAFLPLHSKYTVVAEVGHQNLLQQSLSGNTTPVQFHEKLSDLHATLASLQLPADVPTKISWPQAKEPSTFVMWLAGLRKFDQSHDRLQQLMNDFPQLRGNVADILAEVNKHITPARDHQNDLWRHYQLPLNDAGYAGPMHLYVHRDHERHNFDPVQNKKESQTRFIVDAQFTNMGAVQIEGLVRPSILDVILRSEKTLPPPLCESIQAAYQTALMAINYAGELSFQAGHNRFYRLTAENPMNGAL